MLRLDDALKRSAAWPLSAYQGTTVAAMLCARTIAHVKSMNREDPLDQLCYNFWTQHHRLDETIRYIFGSTSTCLAGVKHTNDANEFMLILMLKAISTCLHQAVITKSGMSKGSHRAQAQSSEELSLQNAMDIAELLRTHDFIETVEVASILYLPAGLRIM
jgi:hypothetical protein